MRRDARGQILPLFALMLVGIFAIAALAIDVSSAYSARQFYRTAADAAALASVVSRPQAEAILRYFGKEANN